VLGHSPSASQATIVWLTGRTTSLSPSSLSPGIDLMRKMLTLADSLTHSPYRLDATTATSVCPARRISRARSPGSGQAPTPYTARCV
jgi:hypothetical protein